jgi:hypothetical protein
MKVHKVLLATWNFKISALELFFGSDCSRTEALDCCFDAFSSRELVSTSLETAAGLRNR